MLAIWARRACWVLAQDRPAHVYFLAGGLVEDEV